MVTDDYTEPHCPTALVYETTEEARLLLEGEAELVDARRATAEAAYYLSDAIEPDERRGLLAAARTRLPGGGHEPADRVVEALALLADAECEVEELMRGPNSSSELRIALRALRQAIGVLASEEHDGQLQAERLRVLQRLRDRA